MCKNKPGGIEINDKASHLSKLKDSIRKYDQPFEPVGDKDWETLLLKGFTPEAAHADELATLILNELGGGPEEER